MSLTSNMKLLAHSLRTYNHLQALVEEVSWALNLNDEWDALDDWLDHSPYNLDQELVILVDILRNSGSLRKMVIKSRSWLEPICDLLDGTNLGELTSFVLEADFNRRRLMLAAPHRSAYLEEVESKALLKILVKMTKLGYLKLPFFPTVTSYHDTPTFSLHTFKSPPPKGSKLYHPLNNFNFILKVISSLTASLKELTLSLGNRDTPIDLITFLALTKLFLVMRCGKKFPAGRVSSLLPAFPNLEHLHLCSRSTIVSPIFPSLPTTLKTLILIRVSFPTSVLIRDLKSFCPNLTSIAYRDNHNPDTTLPPPAWSANDQIEFSRFCEQEGITCKM